MKFVPCAALLCVSMAACAQAQPQASHDWSLAAVLERVSSANRDVQAAQRALDEATADKLSAGVTPPAQFSILSQAIDPDRLGHGSAWNRPVDTIFRIDKTFERGNKQALRVRQAEAGAAAAGHDLAYTLRTQRIAAAQAYWDLKLAQEQLSISGHDRQLAQGSSDTARLRQEQGDLSRLEATRLAVEADRAANEESEARRHLFEAQSALAQALALPSTQIATLHAADPWPADAPEAQRAQGAPITADDEAWLAQRADVTAATQRVNQAQAAADLAQSQRKADVTWSVQFEHNPPAGNRLWGVGVAFPLGVDERQTGPVTHALLAVQEAQAQLDKVREAALAERAVQQQAWSSASERVRRIEAQWLPRAREALKAAEFAREQGALALQDVLDARRALHAVELEAASAHADQAKAWAALTMTEETHEVTP